MPERDLIAIFGGIDAEFRRDEPMSAHTTLGIGGPAELYIEPGNAEALAEVMKRASLHNVPVMPLGGGSNVLVSDAGIEGVVVAMRFNDYMSVISRDQHVAVVHAGAGVPLQRLINFLADEGLTGLEGLSGIPGLLGGAIAGNAGSFGAEIKDAIANVALLGRDGGVRQAGLDEIRFEYRRALIPEDSIVLSAMLRLRTDAPAAIRERMAGFLARKKLTQPVGERSAGCVFKNPEAASAGQMIDTLGFKGERVGDIEVSALHANFFVNRGNGTAADFRRLMALVGERVLEATGVALEPEIRMVGRW